MKRDRPFVSATLTGLFLALIVGAFAQYFVFVIVGLTLGSDAAQNTVPADYFVNGLCFAGVQAPINILLGITLGLAYAAQGRPISRRRATALGAGTGVLYLAISTGWLAGSLFGNITGDNLFLYLNLVLTMLPTGILSALLLRWRVPLLPPLKEK